MTRAMLFLLALFAFTLPAPAQDKKPKADDKDAPKDGLVRLGDFVVTLTQVEGSQKHLTVQYTQQIVVPNLQAGWQNALALLQRQQEILRNPNPFQRRQLLMQLVLEQQRGSMNAFQVHQVPVTLGLQCTDELKVRVPMVPLDFDDKGRPRRYTAKELKELKGPDPKQPGFTGDFESLKSGQVVLVSLSRPKNLLKKPDNAAKDVDRDLPPPKEGADRLTVTRVVVLVEPQR